MKRRAVVAALALLPLGLLAAPAAAGRAAPPSAATFFAGCASPTSSPHVVVGRVACQRIASHDLGGVTAFSYYVPPGCAPATGHRCPTMYLLHGFGGDYTSMLGTPSAPSAWVAALRRGPRSSPDDDPTPWDEADPATWTTRRPLRLVLVAPDGRTVPGGYGPGPGLEGFWVDWNPRYARGGDHPHYGTPPPRFADSLIHELMPYVEAHLPVGHGRGWRALAGTSLGGYGSYAIGLQHPDLWASLGAVSGIMNILLVPGLNPSPRGPSTGAGAPVPFPYLPVPGVGGSVPPTSYPGPAKDFAVVFDAFGDPSADETYYRGNMPRDLALNGHARRGRDQALALRDFSNDAIPRRSEDVTDPSSYLMAQAFESVVRVSNEEMEHAFAAERVANHYALHPGIHSDPYWNPWLRRQLSAQYRWLRHPGTGGTPPPRATSFSYRSIASHFSVWGWRVRVHRPTTEFLELDDVRCSGFTIRGTGKARVTVPAVCHTGIAGSRQVAVNLGASPPINPPAATDALRTYGRTVHVALTPLRHKATGGSGRRKHQTESLRSASSAGHSTAARELPSTGSDPSTAAMGALLLALATLLGRYFGRTRPRPGS